MLCDRADAVMSAARSARSLTLKGPAQKFQILGDLPVGLAQFLDAADAVHDSGVIASPETPTDFGQRPGRHLLAQIHRDLPWPGKDADALRADHVRQSDVVMIGDLALDFLDGNVAFGGTQNIGKAVLG